MKKEFKDNPALDYLKPAEADEVQREYARKGRSKSQKEAEIRAEMEKWRITETRSKRVHILMTPSLHKEIKARAKARGLSINSWIHLVLEQAVK